MKAIGKQQSRGEVASCEEPLRWVLPDEALCLRVYEPLQAVNLRECDVNALNLLFVRDKYRITVAERDGVLFRYFDGDELHRKGYGFPLPLSHDGMDLAAALDALHEDAKIRETPLRFCLCNAWQRDAISLWQLTRMGTDIRDAWQSDAGDSDYLFDVGALAAYPGARFSRKRNWVHRFTAAYPDWRYLPLGPATAHDALAVAEAWFDAREEAPETERAMLRELLADVSTYPVFGGILYAGPGLPAAMTVASLTSPSTCDVHYQKAVPEFMQAGAIPLLIQCFARESRPESCTTVNLEEDLSLPGLRTMKRSYFPSEVVEKFHATLA